MSWKRELTRRGIWTFSRDGFEVMQLSIIDHDRVYPSVLAGVVEAVLNDFDAAVGATERTVSALMAGWSSAEEYRTEVEAVKVVVAGEPPAVRAKVQEAWTASALSMPLPPRQMLEWQQTVDRIIADHHAPESEPRRAA